MMRNLLSSESSDTERSFDGKNNAKTFPYPSVKVYRSIYIWIAIQITCVAALAGFAAILYFTRQELAHVKAQLDQYNQAQAFLSEPTSGHQLKLPNDDGYKEIHNAKSAAKDDKPRRIDDSSPQSSQENMLEDDNIYKHSRFRQTSNRLHKLKTRSNDFDSKENVDYASLSKVQRIGAGIHLTHGDQDHNSIDKDLQQVVRYWKTEDMHSERLFSLNYIEGTITTPYSGRYLIYAQISLTSNVDSESFSAQFQINRTSDGSKIVKCHSNFINNSRKRNEIFCTMTTQAKLSAKEKLQIINLDKAEKTKKLDLNVDKADTFWGIIYLGQ